MNHWKIVKSIWEKVVAKNPVGTLSAQLSKEPTTNFPLRVFTGNIMQKDGRKNVCTRIVPATYSNACKSTYAQNVRFLNFNTDVECYNAWQSYLTKFAMFCFIIDETTKLAPYMGDYTEPWTDKRFKQYFELTDIEWQLIDKVILE